MSGYPKSVKAVATDSDHVIVTFRSIAICIWLRETRVGAIEQLSATLEKLAERQGAVGLVQIIERGTKSLDSDARQALAQLLNQGCKYIRASAVVCDGEGFRAAAVRMIVSGIAQLSNPGYPHEVFANTLSASRLVAQSLSETAFQAEELTGALDSIIADVRTNARAASTAAAG